MAFVPYDDVLSVVTVIVMVQRDFGNRADRGRARMKYLVHDWGLSRFKANVQVKPHGQAARTTRDDQRRRRPSQAENPPLVRVGLNRLILIMASWLEATAVLKLTSSEAHLFGRLQSAVRLHRHTTQENHDEILSATS